jgi:hypothetical protein
LQYYGPVAIEDLVPLFFQLLFLLLPQPQVLKLPPLSVSQTGRTPSR